MSERVIVGMSGGVDSSVAASLLLAQGYRVEGLFMKNWEEDDDEQYCAAAMDLADAKSVCEQLDIQLHTVNFSHEYWDNVFEYFLQEYKNGRTPNPDILCNKEIKFKAFLDYAMDMGADYIATGHYARIVDNEGNLKLLKGIDDNKDQSYFLHALGQKALSRTLFPLGAMNKTEIRKIAEAENFTNARKKDSTGICFIGERKFADFLKQFIPASPGDIITDGDEVIGRHNGLMFHTIGQRQGLGIGGVKGASDEPWFVIGKDMQHNRLIVAQGHTHPGLMNQQLLAIEPTWIEKQPATSAFDCEAKIRYRQAQQACRVTIEKNGSIHVSFNQPQRAITPGQAVVFYSDEECLGGAIIDQRI